MIPTSLDEWTLEAVKKLIEHHRYELESFDYKKQLPDKQNKNEKGSLSKICCAFANSNGGFIVFGVDDNKANAIEDRLVGIDSEIDFFEHFGNFPSNCSPSVEWTPKSPAIDMGGGRVIHIIYVPKSQKGPHAVRGSNDGWVFKKRTNKGNEDMSYEEVRAGFINMHEKLLKIKLLKSELENIKREAAEYSITDPNKLHLLVPFDTEILNATVADTYNLTASNRSLHELLSKIKRITRRMSQIIKILHSNLSNLDGPHVIKRFNDYYVDLGDQRRMLTNACGEAISELNVILDT